MKIGRMKNFEHRMDRSAKATMPWSLGFAGFLVNADNRAIAPILPAIAAALHTRASMAALLVSAYAIPYGLFQLVYGPIADSAGKERTIRSALLLFAAGTVGCGLAGTFSSLLALRILTGMFAAGIIPTTLAYIGDRFAPGDRPRAIAFFISLSTSGQAMGLVVGGLAAQFVSYRVLFLLIGLAAVPVVTGLWRGSGRDRRKKVAIGGSARDGNGSAAPVTAPEEYPGAPSQVTAGSAADGSGSSRETGAEQRMTLGSRYRMLLRSERSRAVYGLVFFEGLVFYGGFTYLGVYGVSSLGLSYLTVGLLTALYSVGAFLGSRTLTWALARMGGRRLPVTGALGMSAAFAVVCGIHHVWALAAGFLILGFGFSYCHSILQTLATELLPSGRGTALSVFAFSLFLGSGVGPALFGWLLDAAGAQMLFAAAALGLAAMAAFCRFWLPAPAASAPPDPSPATSTSRPSASA
ncbi:MAG: MFS transporter [Alicyclobacillus sp.]|nr:MFS transporter [Alicyclobacillus sp.]